MTFCSQARDVTFDEPGARDIVNATWHGLVERFSNVRLDQFVVMPDHLHGIVVVTKSGGASLSRIMRALKSISAIGVNRLLDRHQRPVWQRNYYERVIRNERELEAVRQYIRDNPAKAHCHSEEPRLIGGRGV